MTEGLILTCEHAGNKIPKDWKKPFFVPLKVLNSHRGIDIGAKELFISLKKSLKCPFFLYEMTRLLIELNRSIHHPKLFSEYSKPFTKHDKKILIDNFYLPYRTLVENAIRKNLKKSEKPIVHISVHTFTPVLDKVKREVEIGLLYDPKRKNEKDFCGELQRALKNKLPKEYRVKLNKPYQGKADGFTTHLRKCFKDEEYLGIEIEVNQAIASVKEKRLVVAKALQSSIRSTFEALWQTEN